MGYLVGLMVALCCEACRARSDDVDVRAVPGASLAGEQTTERAKAVEPTVPPQSLPEPTRAPFPSGTREASHLHYCDSGFSGSGDAKLDLVRLGAMCGASNGLVLFGSFAGELRERHGVVTSESTRDSDPFEWVSALRFRREVHTCGRLSIGIEGEANPPLSVFIRDSTQKVVERCRLEGSGFCPSRTLSCDAYDVLVRSGAPLTFRMDWWALPERVASPTASSLER